MNAILAWWCLATATVTVGVLRTDASPIVGGQPVSRKSMMMDFPFMVSLQMANASHNLEQDQHTLTATGMNHFCGAFFVAGHIVATAAHCAGHLDPKRNDVYAVMGAPDLRDTSDPRSQRIYRVQRIHTQSFDPYTYKNDIALLEIGTDDDDDELLPPALQVGIPTEDYYEQNERYDRCNLIGYGSEFLNGPATLRLNAGINQRISAQLCAEKLGRWMAPERDWPMFCAEGRSLDGRQVDACQGDSGGPYLCRRRSDGRFDVVGVVSYGAGCGVPDTPGVYTLVAGYWKWIAEVVRAARERRGNK